MPSEWETSLGPDLPLPVLIVQCLPHSATEAGLLCVII